MDFITCPKCGKRKVSTAETSCPSCGFDVNNWHAEQSEKIVVEYEGKSYTVGTLNRTAFNQDLKNNDLSEAFKKWKFLINKLPQNTYVQKYVANNLGDYHLEYGDYNVQKAIKYKTISALAGEKEGAMGLGCIYDPCFTSDKYGGNEYLDIGKAIEWYRVAAKLGHIYAMNNLGVIYGDHKKDYVRGTFFCWVASQNGNQGAENNYNIYKNNIKPEYLNIIKRYSSITAENDVIRMIWLYENDKPQYDEECRKQALENAQKIELELKLELERKHKKQEEKRSNFKTKFLREYRCPGCGRNNMWYDMDLDVYSDDNFEFSASCKICDRFVYEHGDINTYTIQYKPDTPIEKAPWETRYFKHPCPYCGSYKVRYTKWDDKALSTAFWGAFSYKLHCNYKCDNCKKMWQ